MTTTRTERTRPGWPTLAGHLAIPVGLYLAGCVACVLMGLGVLVGHGAASVWAIAGAFLAGQSMYLLDRVKLCDAWLDPADEAAQPQRFAFLARHSRLIRVLAAVDAVAAAVIAGAIHPLLPVAVVGLLASIVVYAGLPRTSRAVQTLGRSRLKDLLVIKILAVAAGISAYALLVAWALTDASSLPPPAASAWIWAGGFVLLHVLADAMLCDLDDAASDRRFGTRTLAWRWGSGPTRAIAVLLAIGAIALTAATSPIADPPRTAWVRWVWAGSMAATSVWLARLPAGRVRPAVDLRLPAIALLMAILDTLL